MSEPFLAEIRMVGFNFAPRGWALCNGQLLPINQNQALFALLGTTYGGNGQTTFALPDLRGRVPIHTGSAGGASRALGERGGQETHTLSPAEMPAHRHPLQAASGDASQATPAGGVYGGTAGAGTPESAFYAPSGSASEALHGETVASTGGGQPHGNMQPYTALQFAIALQGIFPSPN